MRFEVFRAVGGNPLVVFCVDEPCNLADSWERFGGARFLYLEDENQHENTKNTQALTI